jgi:hypothetical protein
MSWREFVADILMLLHAAFSMFLTGGLLVILVGTLFRWRWIREPRFRVIHLMVTVLLVARIWLGLPCPFTVAEDNLRRPIVTACPLGEPFHKAFHWLAFRGRNPHRFAWVSTSIGAVVVGLFVLNRRKKTALPVRAATTVPRSARATR